MRDWERKALQEIIEDLRTAGEQGKVFGQQRESGANAYIYAYGWTDSAAKGAADRLESILRAQKATPVAVTTSA